MARTRDARVMTRLRGPRYCLPLLQHFVYVWSGGAYLEYISFLDQLKLLQALKVVLSIVKYIIKVVNAAAKEQSGSELEVLITECMGKKTDMRDFPFFALFMELLPVDG